MTSEKRKLQKSKSLRHPQKRRTKDDKNSIRDRLFDFKREQILEVAERLFYERGFKSTTLDAIAAELSVTKPFIYYHFENKYDILHVLVERTMQSNAEVFDSVDIEEGNPTDLLHELCRRVVLLVINSRTSIAMFWREQKEVPEGEKQVMHARKRRHDGQFERIIARGVASGEFLVDDPKLAVLALQGMLNWVYTWYRPNGRLDAEAIADHIANLAVRSVRIESAVAALSNSKPQRPAKI